ncbi:MAG TPA: hypothetical protein VK607_10060, partial [Kofleriaceae bacterium]|nr:hypothetical protein [Kofleriaceae bacterium]
MTLVERRRLAARVIAIYWLTVLGGLALFTATRAGDAGPTAALWIGACGGTLLGHMLALRDCRLWLTAVIITGVALYAAPLVPTGMSMQLWLSFVPAALCAFWSLGDRSALAAAWFPAVIWMLAILDRSEQVAPDGTAAVLLGGLAALFLWFLSAREARRVALWRSVAAQPLAAARPTELLRQPPGRQLARAGWWLSVGAITAAITVWLAPPLWRTEALGNEPVRLAVEQPRPTLGPPCCPIDRAADTESSRVREYLAIGLGHDRHTTALRDGLACRVCSGPAPAGRARGGRDAGIAAGDPGSAPSTGVVIDASGVPRGAGVPI